MGFLIIIPFAALAVWSIVKIYQWLHRGNFTAKWWRAFGLLSLVGLAVGIWFAFFLNYKVANVQLAGFPIPVEISNHEKPGAPYIRSSDMPPAIRIGGMITDVLSGIALCLAPIAAAAFLHDNRDKDPHAIRAPQPRP